MPVNSKIVGQQSKSFTHEVDARWIMAYAASLGDTTAVHLDTQAGTVVAHPLFPVCLEWPVILDCATVPGSETATPDERARSVHATHDLHILRPIHADETLTTQATIIGIRKIKPGAAQTMRLDTTDEVGELVSRTYQLSISRGVDVLGEADASEPTPESPRLDDVEDNKGRRIQMPVARGAAHTYTECARIWNPIHTDRQVALAAGLPDIILHGTATLAMAVSKLIEEVVGNPERVRRIGGRFSAMVLMPSVLTLVIHGQQAGIVGFSVLTDDGKTAFSNGFLCFD